MRGSPFGRAIAGAMSAAAGNFALQQSGLAEISPYRSRGKGKTRSHDRGGTRAYQRAALKTRNRARNRRAHRA